jgi:hypothetical protein
MALYSPTSETETGDLLVQYQEDFMDYWKNGRTTGNIENDVRKDIINNER